MELIAVVTARAASRRLANKNALSLAGKPILEWSILAAKFAGLRCIVTSDMPEARSAAERQGVRFVQRPRELATFDAIHRDAVLHAVRGEEYDGIVLLQPTSPFRTHNIVTHCVEAFRSMRNRTVVTARSHHGAIVDAQGALIRTHDFRLWDGCVAVCPRGDELLFSNCYAIHNDAVNSLQIDHPADYEEARRLSARVFPLAGCIQHEEHT